ncbi:MAG: aminotransferase class I/II-fold pyridoxal phosphate-dependent enzyme [Oscillospiraceae bacterium]
MDYFKLDKNGLQAEQQRLTAEYEKYKGMGLKLDMSRGKPAPEQLDLSLGMLTVDAYKDDTGVDARNYGQPEGLPEARRFFAGLLGALPEETIVGGNSSLQLMYMMIELGCTMGFEKGVKPWNTCKKRKFLCPSPGYDRHFRITEGFGFELVAVPMTESGPDMDIVEELAKDETVKGIWCVPLYSNPDGFVYSDETVRRLASMQTASPDFKIFWDNAYAFHHLTDTPATVLNILQQCREAGNENRPLMFASTSKVTFAGAGVAAMAASPANLAKYLNYTFPMTIGFDKMNQLRHVRYLQQEGGMAAHMKKHAALIVPKFDKVIEVLHARLGECGPVASWTEPSGGYFLSFYTMKGCARRIVELCGQAGVVLTGAGAVYPYGVDPEDRHIRIAPTFPPIGELEIAAELLCIASRLASVEKLLAG